MDELVRRIWDRDHTLWKPQPTEIVDRLGWLTIADAMRPRIRELERFADRVSVDGFDVALLLGMGGSSLAPEVFSRTFGNGGTRVEVLDTTHPAAVAAAEAHLDLERTLFLVASKSGTTIETRSHLDRFWHLTGGDGRRFVAITDPGTPLEELARERGFRSVFLAPPDVGGRYSAMSVFGLVPAALVRAPLERLLDGAVEMAEACRREEGNPGFALGEAIGGAARVGADKLTFVLPEVIASFGDWIEQLVAESTGKKGTGIVPVVGEDVGPPEVYGDDRFFVAYGEDPPDLGIRVDDGARESLGAEMFRWEFATAVAGHLLRVNPFDQPDVAAAKKATSAALEEGYEDPGFDDLGPLLERVRPGGYLAIQAFLQPSEETREALQRARIALRDRLKVATTLGFGPRFLHSTGQLHKGGPDTVVCVQVVDEERDVDVEIPGRPYTFGKLIDAQALGDLRALRAAGRRAARVTLDTLTKEAS
ncbi:MAG TPA: glucose-6-phosphate isomerase [Actinomycetota bacterium]